MLQILHRKPTVDKGQTSRAIRLVNDHDGRSFFHRSLCTLSLILDGSTNARDCPHECVMMDNSDAVELSRPCVTILLLSQLLRVASTYAEYCDDSLFA